MCLRLFLPLWVMANIALAAPAGCPLRFTDVTAASGIKFVHTDGDSGQYFMAESVSAGLSLFDYDNDGRIDIYFLNGSPLKGPKPAIPPKKALYRNLGNWQFEDVTDKAGVGDTGFGLGVTVGDYDNDGYLDLFLNNEGRKVLYHNNGNGTFTEATEKAGLGGLVGMGAGACFLDADGDGFLDLYVANYVMFDYDRHVPQVRMGYRVYDGPVGFPPARHYLFHNTGKGTFVDVSVESGIAAGRGAGMGVTAADYDDDGDTDIFVANDRGANFLWRNDGHGHFEEVALLSGVAYDVAGDEKGNMAPDFGDYDNDGRLDLYVTAYENEMPTLYHNLGQGLFEDVTRLTGAGSGTLDRTCWGTGFADFDLDGWLDLFIACGHTQHHIERIDDRYTYKQKNVVLWNQGRGHYVNVSEDAGPGLQVLESSRGLGLDDMDNDGDVDVVILNSRAAPTLLRNDSTPKGHWLQVDLRGTRCNRFGVGSRVKVVAGDLTRIDEVHSGRGYQSHYGTRLNFGLGPHTTVDRVEVRWLGGGTNVYSGIKIDQRVTLVEGGKVESTR